MTTYELIKKLQKLPDVPVITLQHCCAGCYGEKSVLSEAEVVLVTARFSSEETAYEDHPGYIGWRNWPERPVVRIGKP